MNISFGRKEKEVWFGAIFEVNDEFFPCFREKKEEDSEAEIIEKLIINKREPRGTVRGTSIEDVQAKARRKIKLLKRKQRIHHGPLRLVTSM